ncbi:hypothetical protein DAPPUDRAFT_331643 [Daphnia pulex]|uniref:CCHC-type domain-containing protein n=1 Tax=Daphnia pulex TaxID=6669 RepID=E9HN05_DAPPU|nr:hypothetical protein DAPPUDRAFT_331643 [Daphnia pulex]|eukprot:EFX66843.1 hypothetical protein DAPPUDRAFT_331643 [Daphnia pulex]
MSYRDEGAARRAAGQAEPVLGNHGPVDGIRGIRKERDAPIFRGESHEDAVDWLFRYEDVSRYNGWSEDEKTHVFSMHLEGVARRWYLSLLPAPGTFADLRARFLLAFKPPNYDLDLESKLRHQTQEENEPVMTYCHDVIYLCSHVDLYPFLDPARHTSQDFMRLVQVQCQAVLLGSQGVSPPPPSVMLQQPVPGPSNYVTRDELKVLLADEMKEIKGLLSQKSKEGPAWKGANRRQQRQQQGTGTNQEPYKRTHDGRPICFRCQEAGHIGRYCPKTRTEDKQQPSAGNA